MIPRLYTMKRLLPFLFIALLLVCSCKTKQQTLTEYVYLERTDTLRQTLWRVDSVSVHDSIVTVVKGDSVLIERWHTKYKEKLRIDTVERIKAVTEWRTRTEVKTVEVNKLYWWQKALMWIGGIGIFAGIGLGTFRVFRVRL